MSFTSSVAANAAQTAAAGIRGYGVMRLWVTPEEAITFATDENMLVPFGFSASHIQSHRESWAGDLG
jgi:hypothetical protein